MKISKESWHYQMVSELTDENVPNNLCPYIRALMAAWITSLFVVALCLGVLACVAEVIGEVYTYFTYGEWINFLGNDGFPWGMFLLIIVSTSILIITVGYNFEAIKRKVLPKEKNGNLTTWGLVEEATSSFHNKVCPIIEFVEEKKETKEETK